MRYDPKMDSYHMWIGENGESRRLFYHMDGEDLSLTKRATIGLCNWQLLLDAYWDWRYLYSTFSWLYVPDLATLFSRFLHGHGPATDSVVSNIQGD